MKQATKTSSKVLFLITKATHGGAQKYVLDLATSMPPEFEAVVAYGERGRLAENLEAKHVRVIHLPSLTRDVGFVSEIVSFREIYRCIRTEKPNVLHLNSSKAAAFGALAGRILGVPKIIFTVHGWPFKESRGAAARLAIRLISWLTALMSHVVIVVSKEDDRLARKMPGIRAKTFYIPLGIDPPHFLSREEALAAFELSGAPPRLVTIAELTKNKGVHYAIRALAILKRRGIECSYAIIGDGEDRASLDVLANTENVAERVAFLGFVPGASAYLKAFDIYVLPSLKEGMPYVLLEAGAAGIPIVATTAVSSGSVPSGDAEALADALENSFAHAGEISPTPAPTVTEMAEETIRLYLPTDRQAR